MNLEKMLRPSKNLYADLAFQCCSGSQPSVYTRLHLVLRRCRWLQYRKHESRSLVADEQVSVLHFFRRAGRSYKIDNIRAIELISWERTPTY